MIYYGVTNDLTQPDNPYNVLYESLPKINSCACYVDFWASNCRRSDCRLTLLLSKDVSAPIAQEFVHWARSVGADMRYVIPVKKDAANNNVGGNLNDWGEVDDVDEDDDYEYIPAGEERYIEYQWRADDSGPKIFVMLNMMRFLTSEFTVARNSRLDANIVSIFTLVSNRAWQPNNHFPVEHGGYHDNVVHIAGNQLGNIICSFYTRWLLETDFAAHPKIGNINTRMRSAIEAGTFLAYARAWLSGRDNIAAYKEQVAQKQAQKDRGAQNANNADVGDRPRDRGGRFVADGAKGEGHPDRVVRVGDARVLRVKRE